MKKKIFSGVVFTIMAVASFFLSNTTVNKSNASLKDIISLNSAQAECCSDCGICWNDKPGCCDWCDFQIDGIWAS